MSGICYFPGGYIVSTIKIEFFVTHVGGGSVKIVIQMPEIIVPY